MDELAINKGTPAASKTIPYGSQWIIDEDIKACSEALKTDWITQGPKITEFEEKLKTVTQAKHIIAVANGTAALHVAMIAAGVTRGVEVITTPYTFAATSNSVLYCNGTPVFADIEHDTFNIDPDEIRKKITPKTKVIAPVHFNGFPCKLKEIYDIAKEYNLTVVEDCAHALGAKYKNEPIGKHSDLATFSFHPVKHITTGEGGAVATKNDELAAKLRALRHHGIVREAQWTQTRGSWYHEMQFLGLNYRITDFQCALGSSQLKRLDFFIKRRNEIANEYNAAFSKVDCLILPPTAPGTLCAWHLYPLRLNFNELKCTRNEFFNAMKAENIGVNVHYIPTHLHPYYQSLGYKKGLCPKAELAFDQEITLPLYPKMSSDDVKSVILAVQKVATFYKK